MGSWDWKTVGSLITRITSDVTQLQNMIQQLMCGMSGNTTYKSIINLLMRFYDIDHGEILLDGKNIRDIVLKQLRDEIGIVLQDTVLFFDTVRANLTYAQPDVSEEELEEAARRTRCDWVIRSLPDHYETMLSGAGPA